MDQKIYRYEIDGRKFLQKTLVLGQIKQIQKLLSGIVITEGLGMTEIAGLLGDKLPEALAIVLHEEGIPLQKKDVAEMAEFLEFATDVDLATEIVTDFFDCTPIASLIEQLAGAMGKVTGEIASFRMPAGSTKSSSLSPAETSPDGTPSSGDSPSKSAPPILNTVGKK